MVEKYININGSMKIYRVQRIGKIRRKR